MGSPTAPARAASTAAPWRRWMPLVALVAVTLLVFSMGWHRSLSLTKLAKHHGDLQAFVDANQPFSTLGFVALYAGAVALSLPGAAVLTIASGLLFGWLLGGVVAAAGAVLGATLVFLIARGALGEALSRVAGPRIEALRCGFRRDALSYLLFLRLVPLFPFWLVNLAPALLGVPLGTYVLGTAIGILPGTFAFAVVGSGLDGVIETQRAQYDACVAAQGAASCHFKLDWKNLVSPGLLAAFAALGCVALLPVGLKAWKARAGAAGKSA